MCFFEDIQKIVFNEACQIIDARSENRFLGLEPEPRQGLRSGQIPNSKNLFYANLLKENGLMKSPKQLKEIFSNYLIPERQTVFSCGSGITACILALGAELAGYTNLCVYDGSWTEYGSLT
jgi:thiosulfate/3-mercaptopyruvate sulfurtransferase